MNPDDPDKARQLRAWRDSLTAEQAQAMHDHVAKLMSDSYVLASQRAAERRALEDAGLPVVPRFEAPTGRVYVSLDHGPQSGLAAYLEGLAQIPPIHTVIGGNAVSGKTTHDPITYGPLTITGRTSDAVWTDLASFFATDTPRGPCGAFNGPWRSPCTVCGLPFGKHNRKARRARQRAR